MNDGNVAKDTDERLKFIESSFEEYYAPLRGITLATVGVDMAEVVETSSRTAFYGGCLIGLKKANEALKRINDSLKGDVVVDG